MRGAQEPKGKAAYMIKPPKICCSSLWGLDVGVIVGCIKCLNKRLANFIELSSHREPVSIFVSFVLHRKGGMQTGSTLQEWCIILSQAHHKIWKPIRVTKKMFYETVLKFSSLWVSLFCVYALSLSPKDFPPRSGAHSWSPWSSFSPGPGSRVKISQSVKNKTEHAKH